MKCIHLIVLKKTMQDLYAVRLLRYVYVLFVLKALESLHTVVVVVVNVVVVVVVSVVVSRCSLTLPQSSTERLQTLLVVAMPRSPCLVLLLFSACHRAPSKKSILVEHD